MKLQWSCIVLAACLPAPSHAAPALVANPVLQASVNGVRDPIHARNLQLKRFDVTVVVRGAVTETTIDADFANSSSEVLEGDFRLTLPKGAVVTGYALDVGGRMIDGVLVDAPRAKALYEARVRQRVDPGLAEVSNDNVFTTRVHPIWPGRGRHVRLRFVAPMGPDGLTLPLSIDTPIDGWTIQTRINGTDEAPPTVLVSDRKLPLVRGPDGLSAKYEGGHTPLIGELHITPPGSAHAVISEHRSGERYVQMSGILPEAARDSVKPRPLRVYWDRSRARLKGDVAADIEVLRQVIQRLRAPSVELVAFNSSGARRKTVATADEAAEWLRDLPYRGASSFSALGKEAPGEHCLLFAQNAPTIDRAAIFDPACRLDVVTSAPQADHAWLQHMAQSHGGNAYDLTTLGHDRVVEALAGPHTGVTAVLDQDGKPLPFVPLDAPGGRWLVLARMPEAGPLTIRLTDAAGTREIVQKVDGEVEPFDGPAALIAADQLALLGASDQRQRFVDHSRRYGIASPSLSFLVLETPQDYIAAHVELPSNMPSEVRDDFLRLSKSLETVHARETASWMDQVAHEWQGLVTWWSKRFDPAAKPRQVAASEHFDRNVSRPSASPGRTPARPSGRHPVAPVRRRLPPPPPPIIAPPPPVNISIAPPSIQMAPPPPVAPPAPILAPPAPGALPPAFAAPASPAAATIQIDPWQPDRPYLELFDGKPADFDERFLEAEKRHGGLPIFYLDTAEWLRRHGRSGEAAEMVLSALELPSANTVTLGIVADRLERYGQIDRAIELRERQAALDPTRPQPRRLLALALARRAALSPAHAREDLTRAVDLLYAIVTSPIDASWSGMAMIALDEVNALLPRLVKAGGKPDLDPRLVKLLDVDMRVVIDWTTAASDMDLWMDEPNGERAIYNNPRTAIGGHLSRDITQGYGPEEYLLHVAPPGTYTIQANVYAADRLDPNGATLITAHVFRNFGRPTQHEESVDIEVKRDEQGAKKLGSIVVHDGKTK